MTMQRGREGVSGAGPGGEVAGSSRRRAAAVAALIGTLTLSGCGAAIGAAMAAGDIRQGIAGLQQLVAGSREEAPIAAEVPPDLAAPVAGTYRGYQALGADTVRFYVRTTSAPAAPIVDSAGGVTGYALAGLAAVTLDTLEVRGSGRGVGEKRAGRIVFFVEGTQAAETTARTLYPAAFLGRVDTAESEAAAAQHDTLKALELDMTAPPLDELEGVGIADRLFRSVAEGLFTVQPDGGAVYRQESELQDGRALILHFERMSATTLPE